LHREFAARKGVRLEPEIGIRHQRADIERARGRADRGTDEINRAGKDFTGKIIHPECDRQLLLHKRSISLRHLEMNFRMPLFTMLNSGEPVFT